MIHHVRYVCPKDGLEKTTQNISFSTSIGYHLHEGDHEIEGTITAKAFMVVKCICGEEHKFLVEAQTEII